MCIKRINLHCVIEETLTDFYSGYYGTLRLSSCFIVFKMCGVNVFFVSTYIGVTEVVFKNENLPTQGLYVSEPRKRETQIQKRGQVL